MDKTTSADTYTIDCLDGRWGIVLGLDKRGRAENETYVCKAFQYQADINPADVTSIRPITKADRDIALGPPEEDGIPGIHPDAHTIIETRSDRVYVVDRLKDLITGEASSQRLAELTPASLLILQVARVNPQVVALPIPEDAIIASVATPERTTGHYGARGYSQPGGTAPGA